MQNQLVPQAARSKRGRNHLSTTVHPAHAFTTIYYTMFHPAWHFISQLPLCVKPGEQLWGSCIQSPLMLQWMSLSRIYGVHYSELQPSFYDAFKCTGSEVIFHTQLFNGVIYKITQQQTDLSHLLIQPWLWLIIIRLYGKIKTFFSFLV